MSGTAAVKSCCLYSGRGGCIVTCAGLRVVCGLDMPVLKHPDTLILGTCEEEEQVFQSSVSRDSNCTIKKKKTIDIPFHWNKLQPFKT